MGSKTNNMKNKLLLFKYYIYFNMIMYSLFCFIHHEDAQVFGFPMFHTVLYNQRYFGEFFYPKTEIWSSLRACSI